MIMDLEDLEEAGRLLLAPFLNWSATLLILAGAIWTIYKLKSINISGKVSTASRSRASYVNDFPGPTTLPLIGNGHQMLFQPREFYSWSWGLCRRWGGEDGGGVMKLWRLHFPVFFVSSFEITSHLLGKSNFVAKSVDIDIFWRTPGGNGLSSAPAHVHRSRRKLLHPGFSKQVVEGSIGMFCEESRKLVKRLEGQVNSNGGGGGTFEVMEFLMPCSFRIICRTTFGDGQSSDAEAMEQMHALHTVSVNMTNRVLSPYLWLKNDLIYFNFTGTGRRTKEYMKVICDFGEKAIKQQRRKRESKASCLEEASTSTSTPPFYLDMLLDLQEKGDLQESDLLGEVNNFIVAGYDTTALTIGWTLFALATNSRCHQDKIYEEVKDILLPPGEGETMMMTTADIKKMVYLELCIKEALRMYPTSPVLPRSTTDDMPLPDGRVIPAGSDVMIMVDMIHRDPKWFPNPDQFVPERHLERIPAFLPFGSGARNCIGQVYAMHQVKVELAYLLKNFIWETEEKPESIPRLFQALMSPAEGIHFRITRRDSGHEALMPISEQNEC